MQPGVPAINVAKLGQVAPRAYEGVLDGILGEVRISEDQAGRRVEAGRGGGSERLEGLVIAALRALDEILLHIATVCRSRRPLSESMAVGLRETVPTVSSPNTWRPESTRDLRRPAVRDCRPSPRPGRASPERYPA
jgi:hypothetical protein